MSKSGSPVESSTGKPLPPYEAGGSGPGSGKQEIRTIIEVHAPRGSQFLQLSLMSIEHRAVCSPAPAPLGPIPVDNGSTRSSLGPTQALLGCLEPVPVPLILLAAREGSRISTTHKAAPAAPRSANPPQPNPHMKRCTVLPRGSLNPCSFTRVLRGYYSRPAMAQG